MKKKSNLKSLDQFVDEQYGRKGTSKRDKLEKDYRKMRDKQSLYIQGGK